MRLPGSNPGTVICPYPECLAEFHPREILFRDQMGDLHPARWSAFKGLQPPKGVSGTLQKVCPNENCRRDLPPTAGVYDSMMLGLVGARASGKSHYVAALVEELSARVGARFNSSLMALDWETQQRYDNEFYRRLYLNSQEIPPSSQDDPPLLYELRMAPTGSRGRWRGVTLALYDRAGEAFERMNDIAEKSPYLERVRGLVLFVDPLQVPRVREIVGNSAKLPPDDDLSGRPSNIVANVVSVVRSRGLLNDQRPFQTPVAVTFTKCDVLQNAGLIRRDSQWHDRNRYHDGSYDRQLHEDISGVFGSLMQEWAPAAHQSIAVNFADYAFFGVSATGCASDDQGNYPHVSPWRVEEPVLWLLWKLGIISG